MLSAEIEKLLCDHAAIEMVAVIGVPDERLGEVGKAFVVPRPQFEIDEEKLIQWSKNNMANYKVPRRIEFVENLPLNASGKVMKKTLRDLG